MIVKCFHCSVVKIVFCVTFQSQPGPFEEEDCTVPSTPTLSLPRRADGFAEALK